MRSCAAGSVPSPGHRPATPRNPPSECKRSSRGTTTDRSRSRAARRPGLSAPLSRQQLGLAAPAATAAAAMDARKPSGSTTPNPMPSSLASRPRLSSPSQPSTSTPPLPPPPPTAAPPTAAPPSPAAAASRPAQRGLPRRPPPLRRKGLDAWLDSIVSACDDAVGSRLSGALLQADAAAVAALRRKEEERASERNYERYQRRFPSSSSSYASASSSATAASAAAAAPRQRRRTREGEEDGAGSDSSLSYDDE